MIKLLSFAAALGLAAAPTLAQESAEPAPAKEKMVCKKVQGTGWRLSSDKVCKKASEWRALSQETRKEYRDYGRTGSQGDLNGD